MLLKDNFELLLILRCNEQVELDHIGHHHIMFLGKGVISQKQNPFYISLPNIKAFES